MLVQDCHNFVAGNLESKIISRGFRLDTSVLREMHTREMHVFCLLEQPGAPALHPALVRNTEDAQTIHTLSFMVAQWKDVVSTALEMEALNTQESG